MYLIEEITVSHVRAMSNSEYIALIISFIIMLFGLILLQIFSENKKKCNIGIYLVIISSVIAITTGILWLTQGNTIKKEVKDNAQYFELSINNMTKDRFGGLDIIVGDAVIDGKDTDVAIYSKSKTTRDKISESKRIKVYKYNEKLFIADNQ